MAIFQSVLTFSAKPVGSFYSHVSALGRRSASVSSIRRSSTETLARFCGREATPSFRVRVRVSDHCCSLSKSSLLISSNRSKSFTQSYFFLQKLGFNSDFNSSRTRTFPQLLTFAKTVNTMAEVENMDPVQRKLMYEDECILVDENDEVIGHDSKYNCHLMEKIEKENLLHRAFSIFLFNNKHELLLQKRSATKVTFPQVWTNTCCSHPLFRESEMILENQLGVKNAGQRKLFDELGIVAEDAPVNDFTCLGRIHYKAPSNGKWGEHEVDYLLFLKRDVQLVPNPEEVEDVRFVNREELRELVRKADANDDNVKLSPWFRLVVDKFLFDWWDQMEKGTLKEAVDMETIHRL